MRKNRKSFEALVQDNKQELLKDKQAIEKIEKRIETRHEFKGSLNTANFVGKLRHTDISTLKGRDQYGKEKSIPVETLTYYIIS
ncbi:FbpB family small basic protein [Niallia oryzisoli]|uniref:FbpB family small basic protein n=1 Tax=Niallia oryzisoli TaxID=1737571 RepID=UPI003BB005A9